MGDAPRVGYNLGDRSKFYEFSGGGGGRASDIRTTNKVNSRNVVATGGGDGVRVGIVGLSVVAADMVVDSDMAEQVRWQDRTVVVEVGIMDGVQVISMLRMLVEEVESVNAQSWTQGYGYIVITPICEVDYFISQGDCVAYPVGSYSTSDASDCTLCYTASYSSNT